MSKSLATDNSPSTEILRLGFDATPAARLRTGIGYYTLSMLKELSQNASVQLYPFVHGRRSNLPFPENVKKIKRLAWPGKALLLSWHYFQAPGIDPLCPDADVVFSPNYLLLPTNKPLIVTIHDLFFLKGRGQDYWSGAFLSAHLQKHLEKRASAVLVDSLYTKQCLLEHFPQIEPKVNVIYPPIQQHFLAPTLPDGQGYMRQTLGLPEQYWLCIGDLSIRKNQLKLLETLALLSPETRLPLVFCGLSPENRIFFQNHLKKQQLKDFQIFLLPYVDETTLHLLIASAHTLLCPSLDEGFGLTTVEALAMGIPVACSNTGSLPEATGNLAFYFDPNSCESIAEALVQTVENQEQRAIQSRKGPAWAQQFSPQAAGCAFLEIARRVRR